MALTLHTSLGDIKVELWCAEVPKLCFNFMALCASGAYDGLTFHRLLPGFMVQGGDPSGKGKGGESVWGGTFPDEFHARAKHNRRGVLSMANNGADTNAQQFFITFDAQPHLDNVYCCFGEVVAGWDTLDKMEKAPVGSKNRPQSPMLIKGVTVHANPLAA